MGILDKHKVLEKNATLLLVGALGVVTIGGIVEIAPLFYLENTIEDVEGMRPYSPLELPINHSKSTIITNNYNKLIIGDY